MTRTATVRIAVCAAVSAVLAGTLPAYAGVHRDPPPTTKFVPSQLDKGPTGEPYVRGKVLHDGTKKLKLKVPHDIWNVSPLRRGYLVQTDDPDSGWGQILYRVGPGGKVNRLRRFGGHVWSVHVDSGGEKVAVQLFGKKNRLVVFDAFGNRVLRKRKIGNQDVLTYFKGRLLLTRGIDRSRLSWYRPRANTTKRIGSVPQWAIFADPRHDVMALRSGGGGQCFDVRRFQRPRTKLWRLCGGKGILAGLWSSPNGKYVLTRKDFHERPPLETVFVRKVADGSVVHRFKVRHFGALTWEGNHKLLMQASAQAKAALVRCTLGGDCHRVTGLVEGADDVYAIGKLGTLFLDGPST